MDWAQLLTITGTISGVLIFMRSETKEWRREHKEDLQKMDDKIDKMEARWNITIIAMDAKLDKMNAKWDEKFAEMDAKWTSVMTAFVSCLKNRN